MLAPKLDGLVYAVNSLSRDTQSILNENGGIGDSKDYDVKQVILPAQK